MVLLYFNGFWSQSLLLGPSWTLIPAGNASWQLSECSEAESVIVTQSRSIPFPFCSEIWVPLQIWRSPNVLAALKPETSTTQYGSWDLDRYVKLKEVQRIELRTAESLFSSFGWSYSNGHEGFLVLRDIKPRLRTTLKDFFFILNSGLLHFRSTPIPLLLVLA